jgi:hypothetical protein
MCNKFLAARPQSRTSKRRRWNEIFFIGLILYRILVDTKSTLLVDLIISAANTLYGGHLAAGNIFLRIFTYQT